MQLLASSQWHVRGKKEKNYTFRGQFDEKPSTILGCPGLWHVALVLHSCEVHAWNDAEGLHDRQHCTHQDMCEQLGNADAAG